VNNRQIGFGIRKPGGFFGYLIGMAVEAAATFALMAVGFFISMLGFYLWK
jgi:hypothetical protein